MRLVCFTFLMITMRYIDEDRRPAVSQTDQDMVLVEGIISSWDLFCMTI